MKTITFKMTFHSIADRDEWMRSEGINPVAFAVVLRYALWASGIRYRLRSISCAWCMGR